MKRRKSSPTAIVGIPTIVCFRNGDICAQSRLDCPAGIIPEASANLGRKDRDAGFQRGLHRHIPDAIDNSLIFRAFCTYNLNLCGAGAFDKYIASCGIPSIAHGHNSFIQ